ncbi:MAG: transcriptional regulator with XRE-family HTH domain [Rickettsiales bacterium]|jgi:transcriptional regulator with XRE-family HTH domain
MPNDLLTKRLTDEMKKQNWTGRKLSTKANLSYNAVHYILSGKTKNTNFEIVNAIADVLGVSPFYLLDENYEKNKQETINMGLAEPEVVKEEISPKDTPYDGDLYRQIMTIVEEVLIAKNILTTHRIEHFTHCIYSQIAKTESVDKEKDIRSYAEGIIDYALNKFD